MAHEALTFRAPLAAYDARAADLLRALQAGDGGAQYRFKWGHSRYKGMPLSAVRAGELDIGDAREVIAHEYAFESWNGLAAFTTAVAENGPTARFELAADAVVTGDVATLSPMLGADPGLIHARSSRRHHATLLHYIGANGVEDSRQQTPANAVDVAELLLSQGADANALADMYDERCTTISMLISSDHPAKAGVQVSLAKTLVAHGAALDGVGSSGHSAVMTALLFGFVDTARALVDMGAKVDRLAVAAGLGRVPDVERMLPASNARSRQEALGMASNLGHADVVALLLDAGVEVDAYNPEGFHSHSTPLHQAALMGHERVARLLVAHGAPLDVKDAIYEGTPLDWALHNDQPALADYLREAQQKGTP